MNKVSITQWRRSPAICPALSESRLPKYIPFQPRNTENTALPTAFLPLIKNMRRLLLTLVVVAFLPALAPAQCYVLQYSNSRRVLKVDGEFVLDYNSLKRIYKFDGDYLLSYTTYKRLLKFDGRFIIRYSDHRRIAYLDGEYLVRYSDYRASYQKL